MLINNGIIDYSPSNLHGRQDIYYPLVEEFNNKSSSFDNDGSSFSSNLESLGKCSQFSPSLYKKILNNINEKWLFSNLMRLLSYRIKFDKIRDPLADFLNNHEEFHTLDNKIYETDTESRRLRIKPFIQLYISSIQFDEKISLNTAQFGKLSLFLPNLSKLDDKVEKSEIY